MICSTPSLVSATYAFRFSRAGCRWVIGGCGLGGSQVLAAVGNTFDYASSEGVRSSAVAREAAADWAVLKRGGGGGGVQAIFAAAAEAERL